jgi:hypothetical protein
MLNQGALGTWLITVGLGGFSIDFIYLPLKNSARFHPEMVLFRKVNKRGSKLYP